MDEAHYGAVRARLETVFSGRVFDSARVNPDGSFVRDNYVVLFGGSPAELGGDRYRRSQVADDNAIYDYTVRLVGVSPSVVRSMVADVRGLLVGWVPRITGRSCRPVKRSGGDDVRPEQDVKPPLFFADEEFELRSLRGASWDVS